MEAFTFRVSCSPVLTHSYYHVIIKYSLFIIYPWGWRLNFKPVRNESYSALPHNA